MKIKRDVHYFISNKKRANEHFDRLEALIEVLPPLCILQHCTNLESSERRDDSFIELLILFGDRKCLLSTISILNRKFSIKTKTTQITSNKSYFMCECLSMSMCVCEYRMYF